MKYEYGRIERLSQSLNANGISKNMHEAIMKDAELVKKSSKNSEKAIWFFNAMNTMDSMIDKNMRYKIREECACCLGGKRQALCKKINKLHAYDEDRIKAINDTHFVFGNEIKIIGKGKYEVSFFPESNKLKKCVCLKDLNEKMSITYCYCCGGHVKHHLETLLGKKVQVKVLSSALSSKGTKNCRFELKEV